MTKASHIAMLGLIPVTAVLTAAVLTRRKKNSAVDDVGHMIGLY
jgi:hypothetical protein